MPWLASKSSLPAWSEDTFLGRLSSVANNGLEAIRRVNPCFWSLLFYVVARTVLLWSTIRGIQCSKGGLEVSVFHPMGFAPNANATEQGFLPLFVLILNATDDSKSRPIPTTTATGSLLRPAVRWPGYALLACILGFATVATVASSRIATGTVCPVGWRWQPLVVLGQIVMCAVDASILLSLGRLRRHQVETDTDVSKFLTVTLLAGCVCICALSIPSIPTDSNYFWSTHLLYVDVRDLVLDSVLASGAILCAFFLLSLLDPTTIALIIISAGLLGFRFASASSGQLLPPLSAGPLYLTWTFTAIIMGLMFAFMLQPVNSPRTSTTASFQRWLPPCYVGLTVLLAASSVFFSPPAIDLSVSDAVGQLMSTAAAHAEQWRAEASASRTLGAAVAEYRRRYRISPPPNFDKWYNFAVEKKSPVIDNFDQIYEDLLPFWGMEPAEIRARVDLLVGYVDMEIGGLRVRNGALQQSPHIHPTHRWMTDSVEKMAEPFVQWLPDMDMAINMADECRVGVPYEEMQALKDNALAIRAAIPRGSKKNSPSYHSSAWAESFPKAKPGVLPESFTNNIRRQIFYDWVAAACPPESQARRSRWWDWSTACVDCAAPHSMATTGGALVSNTSLAGDLCHQPDIAFLSGFVLAPNAMVGTNQPFPIFSQGRLDGFSDILFPSPWNFNQKSDHRDADDPPWGEKTNGLFWRGSSSDGYAAFGSWSGFVRARLVHEAYQRWKRAGSVADDSAPNINVSFTGHMSRCHAADGVDELEMFHQWSEMAVPEDSETALMDKETKLPRQTAFEEHWKFRHLIDMDGAGFSGRLLPFLRSHSLVYRAALFHTWFDDRLQAWYHYVPVDMRLGEGLWSVLSFFAGRGTAAKDGDGKARQIAEQGREWADQALRPEDMQVYMFRLLLEWGRVVQDDREKLGFSG